MSITFTLDGRAVSADDGETLLDVARREGIAIPHLCFSDAQGAAGNCRACVVEVDGERTLAASCCRAPREGMVVHSASERARRAQRGVLELLKSDLPPTPLKVDDEVARWCEALDVGTPRYPARASIDADRSHPAIAVNLDACIQCTRCVRACRDVQANDVIGLAFRGEHSQITFDLGDAMGASTCVACGECVQACPTGALAPANGAAAEVPDQRVDSVCPFCGVGCALTWQVKDDRIVAVEGRDGPANQGRLCVKGRYGFDYPRHPQRLTVPLIRRDDAPKAGDIDLRGVDPLTVFREASWEEALERAAGGLKAIVERDGGKALAGFGSAKGSNEEAYLFQKLVRAGFGTNNVDHCTRLCHASSVAALLEGIGSGAVTAPFTAATDADVVIVIGANPTENHPVAATFFKQAAKTKTLIVMDPRGQALKRHADYMLQFTNGTDVALLNALLNVIIEENLVDQQYIQAHTEGFEALKAHIGAYTPEAMAPICGIDAQTLRTVARIYAQAERSIIFWGMGISQHTHGTDNARCLIALAMVTGHVGRPGTGLHPLRGQNNVQGASDAGLIPMMFPDYQSVEDPENRSRFEQAWGTELDPRKGLTVVEIMDAVHEGVIKGMYIMGENPAMSDPDVQHAREALARLEHLVVQDIFLTETAFHADVVLPASAWPEKDGTVTNSNRQVQMGRKALRMPGEAREDWWITVQLAQHLGLDWDYAGPAEVFAEMKGVMASLNNISWERLQAESAVTYPCSAPDRPGNDIVFGDGFPTPNRRARLVPADIVPPDEQPDTEFPMILTTGRQLEHWHTGAITRRASVLDALEPEAVAALNPMELRRLGVRAGDEVRIMTRRGAIQLRTRSDGAIPEGVVFVPFCYAEAAANTLTNPALDPFGKIPEFKYCAARIESVA
ncbi:MAG: formate dehydrogenase subunit alpha [Gammaproteobacteria bacterium]|nr:formate dehydrogenase subunit alpha [Gammaproteobacteria bacterium]